MAGKIILCAPHEFMGLAAKVKIYVNGEEVAKIGRGEKAEKDISGDSEISIKIAIGCFSNKIIAKDNYVTTIYSSYNTLTGKCSISVAKEETLTSFSNKPENSETPIYEFKGARGRHLKVFEDKCIITTKAGIGSFLTGNVTDGEKTIYYCDILGVQYKNAGITLGYLQFETASSTMNNKGDNFFNENSFTFDADIGNQMEEVANYIKGKINEIKQNRNTTSTVVQQLSSADELVKFKSLLDNGIITQEEFDAKKKQLLGL